MSQAHELHFSFELFPPRTPAGWTNLPRLIGELAAVKPAFFSVTYGAGGSDQNGTYDTLMQVIQQTGIEAAPHLTCIGSTRAGISALLEQYRAAGVRRIVALRGDLPATSISNAAPGEFRYANELVSFIRETHGDRFQLEVAAYPEVHPQAANPEADFAAYVRKIKAGASGAVTQYFYNADAYFDFVERSEKAGLGVPVVPGLMPIVNYTQLQRFSDACGAEIPRWLRLRLESYGEDKASLQAFGLEVVTRLAETLLKGGAPGLHFYTLNQAEPTLKLWRNLGLPTA
ncbi:MAG: methylenetetrahydrofolate reductase [NAD(P)H] [Nevskiaceae bacterium]|nr:MAG: methylenetetrahydrofolate reductase [NAD(P)H] [Nevskiaceae bacterium]TAM25937.1 MAG: methylenetetrahydrofolate reductase [NAD(P)H] [Nevskiaceae bacterium]